ncbi:MAG: 4-(cytidine 5'-diphospho)-2-C-methyl-D-erythritol kinase [Anaerovoracaceae bacterium]
MEIINLKSYAKINLSLDILGKLENGYHQVEMIMQQIDLHDDVAVRFTAHKTGGIEVKASTNRHYLPTDDRNIAVKAAKLMIKEFAEDRRGELRIDIKKRIPVAAGLAGGSGNAAAVLLGINQLWKLDLPLETLCALGSSLGADVPFSISAQAGAFHCALAEGVGTKLTGLPSAEGYIVLSKPPLSVSTKQVYQGISLDNITRHPNTKELIEGLQMGNIQKIINNMINVLEIYTLNRYDKVMYTKNMMENLCETGGVLMSGSGPTVYAFTKNKEEAERVYKRLKEQNKETFLTKTTT